MSAVFISHSSHDREFCHRLALWLQSRQFDSLFLDFDPSDGIPAGRDWRREIYHHLRQCEAFLYVCSHASTRSRWSFAELTYALASGKDVFPIRIDGCELDPSISHLQAIEVPEGDLDRSLGPLDRALQALDPTRLSRWPVGQPPYPGLVSFQESDAPIYFGRRLEIAALRARLTELRVFGQNRSLLVFGSSGSGKSSIVAAGLLPTLRRRPAEWVIVGPFRPRANPTAALASAIASALQQTGQAADIDHIHARLMSDSAAWTAFVAELRQTPGSENATVLLVVDQLEETLNPPTDRHRWFADFLSSAFRQRQSPSPASLLVATIRSDFLPNLERDTSLRQIDRTDVETRFLSHHDLVDVIQGPASKLDVKVEPALLASLLRDATHEEALPLLAFTLRQLWDIRSDSDHITLRDYQAIGGMKGSLERAARSAWPSLPDAAEEDALRRAFQLLVRVNDEGKYLRQTALWRDLPVEAHLRLRQLVDVRLLVSGARDGSLAESETTVEVAHEALFESSWSWLQRFLADSREFLVWRQRLHHRVQDWRRTGALLHDALLSEAEGWLASNGQQLDDSERELIAASIQARQDERVAEQQARQRELTQAQLLATEQSARAEAVERRRVLLKRALGVVAALFVVASLFAVAAYRSVRLAIREREIAQRNFSRFLGSSGIATARDNPRIALLLGVEALTTGRTPEAENAMMRLLETPRGQPIPDSIDSVAISRDGRWLATGDRGYRSIKLWPDANRVKTPIAFGQCSPTKLAFDLPASRIAAACYEGSVRIWKIDQPDQQPIELIHRTWGEASDTWRAPNGVSWRPRTDEIAESAHYDNGVQVWNSRSPTLPVVPRGALLSNAVAYSPDGALLAAAAESGMVLIWRAGAYAAEPRKLSAHDGPATALSFSEDGEWLSSAGADGKVRLWRTSDFQPVATYEAHSSTVTAIAFAPEGKLLATTSLDHRASVFDLSSPQQPKKWSLEGHEKEVYDVAFGRKSIITAAQDGGRVWPWPFRRPDATEFPTAGKVLRDAWVSPRRAWMVGIGSEGQIYLWDLKANAPQLLLFNGEARRDIPKVSFTADERYFAAAGWDGFVRVWDTRNATRSLFERNVGDWIEGVELQSPTGDLTVFTKKASVMRWNLSAPDHAPATLLVAANSDFAKGTLSHGRLFAAAGGQTAIWNIDKAFHSGQPAGVPLLPERVLDKPGYGSEGPVVDADDRWLVARSSRAQMQVWDLRSGAPPISITNAVPSDIDSLAISSDGTKIAASGRQGEVRWWDLSEPDLPPREVLEPNKHIGVFSVSFFPGAETLVVTESASLAGEAPATRVELFDLSVAALKRHACSYAGRDFKPDEWRRFFPELPYRKSCQGLLP